MASSHRSTSPGCSESQTPAFDKITKVAKHMLDYKLVVTKADINNWVKDAIETESGGYYTPTE